MGEMHITEWLSPIDGEILEVTSGGYIVIMPLDAVTGEAIRPPTKERRVYQEALVASSQSLAGERLQNVHLKSSIRQLGRVIVILVLIAIASFAFVTRVVEYAIIEDEVNRIGGFYRAIAQLIPTSGTISADLSRKEVYIEASPYVAFGDSRIVCSAILSGMHNSDVHSWISEMLYFSALDDDLLNPDRNATRETWHWTLVFGSGVHINNVLFHAVFERSRKFHLYPEDEFYLYQLHMSDVKQLEGYDDYLQEGGEAHLWLLDDDQTKMDEIVNSVEVGQRYLIWARYNTSIRDLWTDWPFSIIEPSIERANLFLELLPMIPETWLIAIEDETVIDEVLLALDWLSLILEQAEENRATMQVMATKDMSAMPSFQIDRRERYISEGRFIDYSDHLEQREKSV
jgi:hypothetical protein